MSLDLPFPDFDKLVALHKSDPAAFEKFRAMKLQECVDSAPEQFRPGLEHLLFQIEKTREAAPTPLAAAEAAAKLMTESSSKLETAFEHLLHETSVYRTTELMRQLTKPALRPDAA